MRGLDPRFKTMGRLEETAGMYAEIQKKEKEMKDLESIVSDTETPEELIKMAKEEIEILQESIREIERTALIKILPEEEDDEQSAVLEVRAGAGGNDSCIFVEQITSMFEKLAQLKGWKFSSLSKSDNTDTDKVRKTVSLIEGDGVFGLLKHEIGLHRAITETDGKVQTSAATVAVLPEEEITSVSIHPNDLRIDVFKSSGNGGQSVNTTESAVRITHIPSGISVSVQDERCQHKNKERAMKYLSYKLYQETANAITSERVSMRREQIGTGEWSERIRTYNFQQDRVTDHRIGVSKNIMEKMLDGSHLLEFQKLIQQKHLEQFITSLAEED